MLFTKKILDRGISFSAINNNKFKASVLAFSISTPLDKILASHSLLFSGLLRRGTKKYPSLSMLNRTLDELYGSFIEVRGSNIGNNLSFCVTAEVLDNKYVPDGTDTLGGVIDILSDLIINPRLLLADFDNELFLQEKKIAIDMLNSEKNNTRAYSIRKCIEYLEADNTQLPSLQELISIIEEATLDEVVRSYKTLLRSAPLDVFYVGSTDPEEIASRIRSSFADYPCCSRDIDLNHIVAYKKELPLVQTEKMPVSQGKLAMGFTTGVCINENCDDYYAVLVLNEIFGGSPASKLFINVREKKSLCYYCSSSYSIFSGIITASSGIEVDKYETVKQEIQAQLCDIKRGNISKTELDFAQKSLSNSYRQLYDSPFDLQSFYGSRAMFDISDGIEDCIRKINAVCLEDIVRVSQNIELKSVFFVEGTGAETEEVEYENE